MQKYLIKISKLIEEKPIFRHLLFLVATIITIGFVGYYFGTFDQASHIPFLKKNTDPSLYPNDYFFSLRSSHYSFFWLFFIPLYRLGVLEISMFVIHVLATYFTYWAIWRLTKTIFSNILTSVLSIIAFVLPHISFAGFTVFEFSLLNRTFTLPFLLLAMDFYLKRFYWLAYLILGIMYNFHVVSVNFVMAMFLFDSIIRIRKLGIKNLFLGLLLFFLAASPVFIWKSSNSHFDLTIHWQWYNIVSKGLLYHIFNLTALNPPIIFLTISGVASLIIFFITNNHYSSQRKEVITNFFYAGLIVLLVEIITSYVLPITIIIQSQIIRVGILLLIFSYFNLSHFISRLIEEKKIDNNQIQLLLTSLILSVSPLLMIIVLIVYRTKKLIKPIFAAIIFGSIIMYIITAKLDIWHPGIHIFPNQLQGYQVQMWAKKNTPKNALFIAPPHLWWFYNLEWRVVSERSTIVTLFELAEAAFEPRYINYWQERFNDMAPNALSQFKGNAMDNFIITAKAYYSLSEKDIMRIAKKYRATYFVVEKPHSYPFPIVYEDNRFIVYKLNLSQ